MWFIPILGLFAGTLIGSAISFQIPLIFAKYLSIAVLASLDSVLGGVRCVFEEKFDGFILISGFIINTLVAALLAYLGDHLGVDLYMAAVFVFGVRIFQNISAIRHYGLAKLRGKKNTEN